MTTAPRTAPLTVSGPAGHLEVLLDEPVGEISVEHVAVVCHPHPLFGGTMTNKVVHILARTFNDLGAPAVRFNFRGVGNSAGSHDDGRGETDDTLAMIDWAKTRWPDAKVWLAGFSFGAAMALKASVARASSQQPVDRLITVAPALRWLTRMKEQENAPTPNCPWLIVQGDCDELVDAHAVQFWAESLSQPPDIKILAGAEHFFHGRLNDLRDAIKEWIGTP